MAPLAGVGMGRVRGVATQPLVLLPDACLALLRELQPTGPLLRLLELWGRAFSCTGPFFFFFFFKCVVIASFKNLFYLFIWLCWVFISVRGLSLVAESRGHSSSRCAGLSLSWPLLLGSTGSRCAGSVVVAHGPSCSAACGILPDQGSNPCPLHRQADSQPLRHQGSPIYLFIYLFIYLCCVGS